MIEIWNSWDGQDLWRPIYNLLAAAVTDSKIEYVEELFMAQGSFSKRIN